MRDYQKKTGPVNSAAWSIRGASLAHQKLTQHDRACLAADIYAGYLEIRDPTVTQLAALTRVSPSYVHAVLSFTGRRRKRNGNGQQLVLPMPIPASLPVGPEERLAEIVREVGVDGVLNLLAATETKAAA
jgi:hypothetical protein